MKKPALLSVAKEHEADDITDHKQNRSSLRWIILIPFIIVLGVLAAISRQGKVSEKIEQLPHLKPGNQAAVSGSGNSGNGEASVKKLVRNNIRLYVKAESNEYDHRGLGGISNLEISVTNPTDYTIDNVRVKIIYIKANGSTWDTKFEDFHSIKPNSKATHKIPDTKRGTSVKQEIVTIKSKSLGL
jgi:hypothetical protein